ncbi:MAG: trigger factor [Candidatus Cloacimonetes bacterium]|nr:trigger factor [Candidatus Cloacimonadota bacterium]
MKSEITDISQCIRELKIIIEPQEALDEYNKVLKTFKNYAAIHGFRKGKVPISMIEKQFGESIKNEFINEKLNDYYKKAIDEQKVKPINNGEAVNVEWEKGKELIATFKFEVMPEVKITDYKNINVPFEEIKFSGSMVDETIKDFQNRMANEITPELSEKNDIISAEIGFLNDEGKVTKSINRNFILGENSYSKAFNSNLTGKKIGDEIKTKLFLKNQQSEDKEINNAIKDKEFLVKVNSIKRKILPEINDEFAKDIEYDSLKDLKEKVAEELKLKLIKDNEQRFNESVITALIEKNKFDLPPSLIKKQAEDMVKPYAEKNKIDINKMIPVYMSIAEYKLKQYFIMEELKKIEKIQVTDEDKEEIVEELAGNLKMEVDKYKEMYKKQIENEEFKYLLEERKIMKFLKENSKIVPYPKEKKEK